MLRATLLGSVFVLSCPGPSPLCSVRNCEGCCTFKTPSDPGTCQLGDAVSACGSGGAVCSACAEGQSCSALRVCKGVDEPYPTGAKFVFASSQTYQGNLGGLAGADAKCQGLAADAGLSGTFRAYLSDLTDAGVPIVALQRFTGDGPWVMRTRDAMGKVLRPFDSRAALAGPPRSPIDQDETGHVFVLFDKRQVWTGSLLDGGTDAPTPTRDTTCSHWTSTSATGLYGIIDVPTDKWSGLGAVSCADDNRLYCFEQ